MTLEQQLQYLDISLSAHSISLKLSTELKEMLKQSDSSLIYLKTQENTVSHFKDLTAAGEKGKEIKMKQTPLSTGEIEHGTFMSSHGHHLLHTGVVLCMFQKVYFINAVK